MFHFETHEHVVLKARLRSASYAKAAAHALQAPAHADQDIVWASQPSPDELVIVRRAKDPFSKPYFYHRFGRPHHGVYERVVVNRKTKSVAVDTMDTSFYFPEPYVATRDLFYEGDSPLTPGAGEGAGAGTGMNFVRQMYWVCKPSAYLAEAKLSLAKMKYNRLFS